MGIDALGCLRLDHAPSQAAPAWDTAHDCPVRDAVIRDARLGFDHTSQNGPRNTSTVCSAQLWLPMLYPGRFPLAWNCSSDCEIGANGNAGLGGSDRHVGEHCASAERRCGEEQDRS